MEYLGYLSSILIGVILGLIGSGGSILTIPVLVYLFSVDVMLATTYSLLIVGLTSAVGSFNYLRRRLVNVKVVMLFGLPSVLSVIITRRIILPLLPDPLIQIGNFHLEKNIALLLLFAILMVAAAAGMIRKTKRPEAHTVPSVNKRSLIVLQGVVVGLVTGLVGAGGGFLIIPALVLWQRIPVKQAVGTSLFIIALNALVGFAGTHDKSHIDWHFLVLICSLSVLGIFIGTELAKKINPSRLKPMFGWFVLLVGSYIMLKELFL